MNRRGFLGRALKGMMSLAVAPFVGAPFASRLRAVRLKFRRLPTEHVGCHPITGHNAGCMCLACDQCIDVKAFVEKTFGECVGWGKPGARWVAESDRPSS